MNADIKVNRADSTTLIADVTVKIGGVSYTGTMRLDRENMEYSPQLYLDVNDVGWGGDSTGSILSKAFREGRIKRSNGEIVTHVAHLVELVPKDLRAHTGIGRSCVRRVQERLDEFILSLGMRLWKFPYEDLAASSISIWRVRKEM